jgi:hypothetical protein
VCLPRPMVNGEVESCGMSSNQGMLEWAALLYTTSVGRMQGHPLVPEVAEAVWKTF